MSFLSCVNAQTPGGVSSGILAWWKADLGVTGSPATAWNDQSGNGFNLTSPTGPVFVENDINFNPSLSFDGSSQYMRVINGVLGNTTHQDLFVYIVSKATNVQNNLIFREGTNGGVFASHLPWGNQHVYYDVGTCCGSSRISAHWGSATGKYHFWTLATSTGTATPSGARKAIYRDGRQLVTNNNLDSAVGNNNDLYVGAVNAGGLFYAGNIAEMLIYSAPPSIVELQRIHSYLGVKYGVTMDQTTPTAYLSSSGATIYDAGTGGTHDAYDKDIAGIGLDNGSGLNQRKSISHSGQRIIMDKGGAFANNEDFLLWGHDGNTMALTTSNVHPSVSYRLGRIWRVDATGTPGSVSVSVILGNGLTNTGNPSDYALLIDGTDTDFSSGAVAHSGGAMINGDTLTFTNVNFLDGSFFTLGTKFQTVTPGNYGTNILGWWRADAGTTGLDPVTRWDDQTANAKHLTATNGPAVLAADINYNPSLNFDGTGEVLSIASGITGFNPNPDMTVIMINRTNTVKSSVSFWETLSGGDRFGSHTPWSNSHVYFDYGTCCGSGRVSGHWGTSTGIYHLWTMAASTGTATPTGTRKAIHRDGRELATNNNSDVGTGVGNRFSIGSPGGTSLAHHGDIAEFVAWSSTPTAIELQRIHSYFGIKYSLTLNSNNNNNGTAFEAPNADGIHEGDYLNSAGTTIWDASISTNYHNDVIGITRDDNSGLLQKQSHTTDDTTRLYLATLSAQNASNTGAFATDLQHVIAGHDQGQMCATIASNMEKPAAISSRIEREWKVTNTAFDGTFSVDWQLNACANIPNIVLADLRLLVDTDGDFSDAAIYSVADGITFSNTGGNITVGGIANAQIPLNTIRYITLGSINSTMLFPVELVNFNAKAVDNRRVELNWQTHSETNNAYFTIERSQDAIHWEEVTTVDGAGTSTILLSYYTTDPNPYVGNSYYRLKQTDYDGQYTYSDIKSVRIDKLAEMVIYPNPTNNQVTVEGDVLELEQLRIYNSLGQDVTSKTKIITQNNTRLVIDMSSLTTGIYHFTTEHSVTKVRKE